MFNSTSLAVSHCLRTSTFASCRWTRLGSIFCAWDQTSSVESACDVGDWGPRLRHSPVRPHESQELDARSTDAQPWAGESAQGMEGLRTAGTGLRCFLFSFYAKYNPPVPWIAQGGTHAGLSPGTHATLKHDWNAMATHNHRRSYARSAEARRMHARAFRSTTASLDARIISSVYQCKR